MFWAFLILHSWFVTNWRSTALILVFDHFLDDSNSDCVLVVTNGKPTKWWEIAEALDSQRFGRNHSNQSTISLLQCHWVLLENFAGSSVLSVEELSKLAGGVRGVTIDDWGVAEGDVAWMVHDNHLCDEGLNLLRGLILGIRGNVATMNVVNMQASDIESHVVTGLGF